MRETADRMWAAIREWFAAMPRVRRIQLAILTVVVVALSIIIVSILTQTEWTRLHITDPATSPQVYTALREMNVPMKVENNTIMVPQDRIGDVQMQLRDQGLLSSADFPSDILADASGFGVTDQHARILYDRQRGEEIRTTLMQSSRIQNALVIVNSGETSPFRIATNTRRATASIMLTLAGGGRLTGAEAQAIGEHVKSSIPGIEYENISITDSEFNYYPVGEINESLDEVIGHRNALTNRLMEQLQAQAIQLLSPIYGINNFQIQPSVRLNFDKAVTEKVEFDPPVPGELEGILRSREELYEMSRRWDDAEGVPGTDSNMMGTVQYPWGPMDDAADYYRTVIGNNWEINETRTRIEHEEGTIQYLSLGVLVNAEIEGIDEEYTEEVRDLLSKAIGVSLSNISVQHIPFSHIDTTLADMYAEWEAQELAKRNRELLELIIMYSVILLLGVMILLLGRTIVKAVRPPPEPEPILIAAGPEGIDFLVDDDDLEMKEYEDVDLTAKSAGLEQIERFIDKDSASVAQLLRNWLSDE